MKSKNTQSKNRIYAIITHKINLSLKKCKCMKFFDKLKSDKKFLLIVIGLVIATFIVPYLTIPGLFLWWFYKKSRLSKKIKVIATAGVGGLLLLLIAWASVSYANDAEPHLTVSKPTANTTIQAPQITIKGTYEPADRKVWINGQEVTATNGSFETTYQLKEGENKLDVTAGNWKRTHVYVTVTRELTDAEKAAKITQAPTSLPTATKQPTKDSTAPKQATPTPKPTTSPKTPEQTIEDRIRASVAKRTNTNKNKIIEMQINKAFDNNKEYIVLVSINGDDNLSDDWIKRSIRGDMAYIYIALYKQPVGVREAVVFAYFPMIDKYGNTSDKMVMKTSLDRTEAQKINWNQDKVTLSSQTLPDVWTEIGLTK